MPRSSCRDRHMRRSPTAVPELLGPISTIARLASVSASVCRSDPAAGQRGKSVAAGAPSAAPFPARRPGQVLS